MFWNAIAGLVNAAEAVIVLAVVSRVNNLNEAGIMAIAFSVANLFMTIGKFGMRNYQIAHGEYDYSFKTFLVSRVMTTLIMVAIIFVYLLYCFLNKEYTTEKVGVIFFVCLWYALEAFEDVFGGKYQTIGRLDVGSKIFSFRWIITILTFVLTDTFTRNILWSSIAAFIMGLLSGILALIYTYPKLGRIGTAKGDKKLFELFKACLPLFISAFAYFYVTNIPKYSINSLLNDEIQAIYSYISMPVFVISLLNSFVYQPQLTKYVLEWREHNYKSFISRIIHQMIWITAIMALCLAGAYVLGIPFLSALYHENLKDYKLHLLILLLGGGFLAIGGFVSVVLTIIEEQKKAMMSYFAVTIAGYIIVNEFIKKFALLGAVCGYALTMFLLAFVFSTVLFCQVKKAQSCSN